MSDKYKHRQHIYIKHSIDVYLLSFVHRQQCLYISQIGFIYQNDVSVDASIVCCWCYGLKSHLSKIIFPFTRRPLTHKHICQVMWWVVNHRDQSYIHKQFIHSKYDGVDTHRDRFPSSHSINLNAFMSQRKSTCIYTHLYSKLSLTLSLSLSHSSLNVSPTVETPMSPENKGVVVIERKRVEDNGQHTQCRTHTHIELCVTMLHTTIVLVVDH